LTIFFNFNSKKWQDTVIDNQPESLNFIVIRHLKNTKLKEFSLKMLNLVNH